MRLPSQKATSSPSPGLNLLLFALSLLSLWGLAPGCQSSPGSPGSVITRADSLTAANGWQQFMAGDTALLQGNFPQASEYFAAALDSFLRIGWQDTACLVGSKLEGSLLYQNRLGEAVSVFERLEPLLSPHDTSLAKTKLLNNAVPSYTILFQPSRALELLDQAMQIDRNRTRMGQAGIGWDLVAKNHLNQGLTYFPVGTMLKQVGLVASGTEKLELSLAKIDSFRAILLQSGDTIDWATEGGIYNNQGLINRSLGNYSVSLSSFNKALAIEEKMGNGLSKQAENYRYNRGMTLLDSGAYAASLKVLQQSHEAYVEVHQVPEYELFESYALMGKAQLGMEQYEAALHNFQLALTVFSLDFSPRSYWDNPDPNKILLRLEILDPLVDKIQALLAITDQQDTSQLRRLLPTFQFAFAVLDRLKNEQFSESSSYLISYLGEVLLHSYLAIVEKLELPLAAAFQRVDNNQASFLLQGLSLNRLQGFSGLPDTLRRQEAQLNIEIALLAPALFIRQKYAPDSQETVAMNQYMEALHSQREALQAQIQQDYPAYDRLRHSRGGNELNFVQDSLLTKGQVLLEYFLGPERLYLFVVSQSGIEMHSRPADSISVWISSLLDSIQQGPAYGKINRSFVPAAEKLYERLITPALASLDPSCNRLLIIPNGVLGSLPFGVLLPPGSVTSTTTTRYRDFPFLVRDYAISYGYSASTYAVQRAQYQVGELPTKTMLAVAPHFEPCPNEDRGTLWRSKLRGQFCALPKAQKEIAQIPVAAKTLYQGKDATKDRFLSAWNQYQFIHLATHAEANPAFPERSGIAFAAPPGEVSILEVGDLPATPWYAKMMVLSACQTAYGAALSGEGIISIARDFALKGIQSIVATQWSVNDESTSHLMEVFYQHLGENLSRDQALQQAQLALIAGGEEIRDEEGHPIHWAAFTLYGDSSPVDLPPQKFPLTLVLGVVGLLIGGGIYWRFRNPGERAARNR